MYSMRYRTVARLSLNPRRISTARLPLPDPDAEGKSAFEQAVGNTSLLRLKSVSDLTGCDVYAKAEYENPGGSVKDRAALSMIQAAESEGLLTPNESGVIVEGTAGNTGIGLALAAATRGYDCVIVLADTQSQEKKDMLRWAGATLVEVPAVPFKDPSNYVHVAERLSRQLVARGHKAFYANQWDNLANREAHVVGTGVEIFEQLKGINKSVDSFSCAMGTGGSLSGCGQALRKLNPRVKIGLTDPQGAALVNFFNNGELRGSGGSISEGIGQGRVTGNIEGFRPDFALEIPDSDALPILELVQRVDGITLGGSAAINVAGVVRVAEKMRKGSTLVTLICDLGGRYASKLYNPSFLRSKSLPVAPWLDVGRARERLDEKYDLEKAVAEARRTTAAT